MPKKIPGRYNMTIQWSDEDETFVVTLPEFLDCKTHGDTYEEAVKSGQEVLSLLIESYKEQGRELPAPATHE